MTLGEKITKQRKENNYTQEQLAELLGVSRQSISKWESDIAYPETEKLIRLGKLFGCSMDYLLNDDITEKSGAVKPAEYESPAHFCAAFQRQLRERKSEKTVFGMPLYHIGRDARGFFAVGLRARGIFSVGLLSRGVVSLGLLSMGVLSFGLFTLGLIAVGVFALGILAVAPIALGMFAVGAIAIGVVSLGAISVGGFSVGALAIGKYIAVGDHARGMIAIGTTESVGTAAEYLRGMHTISDGEIRTLLDANVPSWLSWAKRIFLFIYHIAK